MGEQTITIQGVDYQGDQNPNPDFDPRITRLNFISQSLSGIQTYQITVHNITKRSKGLFVSKVGEEPDRSEMLPQFEPAAIIEGEAISFDVHIFGKESYEDVTVTLTLEDEYLYWGSGVTKARGNEQVGTIVFNERNSTPKNFKQTVTVNTKPDSVNDETDKDSDGSIQREINLSAENNGRTINQQHYNYGNALILATINDRESVGEVKARFVVGNSNSRTLKENADHNIGEQASNRYYTKRAERITIILSWDKIPAPLDRTTPLNIITTVSAHNIENAETQNQIANQVKLFPNSVLEAELDFTKYRNSYSHEWNTRNWNEPFRIDMALPADPDNIDDETFIIKIVSALKTGTSYASQSIDSVGITHEDTTDIKLVVDWDEASTFTDTQKEDDNIDLLEDTTIDVNVDINPTFKLKTNTKKIITVRASIPDSTKAFLTGGTIDADKASNQNLTWESPSFD